MTATTVADKLKPLSGRYEVRRDRRGRLVIPADCLYAFEDVAMVMVGPSPDATGVYVFRPDVWRALIRELREQKLAGRENAGNYWKHYSEFREEPIQVGTHRVDIHHLTATEAGLETDVVVLGRDDRLVILSPQQDHLERIRRRTAMTKKPDEAHS
jgi:DNA-binding transcriptional regulator/RsmH inhibitor MraZ